MTFLEVQVMSDDELRIECAKRMGWRFAKVPESAIVAGDDFSIINPKGIVEYYETAEWEENAGAILEHADVPDYPNDIAAAWELLRRLLERGNDVQLHFEDGSVKINTRSADCLGEVLSVSTDSFEKVARAICEMFLLAME